MNDIVFWLYLFNLVFLVLHEMDSAYWKEWEMFGLPFGHAGFLIIHIPLLFVGLTGLFLIYEHLVAGYVIGVLSGIAGIFTFIIHQIFISKGKEEFTPPISQSILWLTLAFSVLLLVFEVINVSKMTV